MFKLIFIDELKVELNKMEEAMDASDDFTLETFLPQPKIDDMVDLVLSKKPDAIISDFNLNEYRTDTEKNIPYNGVDLIEKIREIISGFPAFVLTSYENDALECSYDVNLVYEKKIFTKAGAENSSENNLPSGKDFFRRVSLQIEHFKKQIENRSKRFDELIDKGERQQLTALEMEELCQLDCFLENVSDGRKKIPASLKNESVLSDLRKFIEETEKILGPREQKT